MANVRGGVVLDAGAGQRSTDGRSVNIYQEIGHTGLRQYGGRVQEEFLPELRGKRGAQKYTEMRENDAIVGAYLYALESLIRQVPWWVESASSDPEDERAAEYVEQCRDDMSQTWPDVISEVMSMLQYGWVFCELVYKLRGGPSDDGQRNSKYSDGYIGWRKMPALGQETLSRWEFDGQSLRGMWQWVDGVETLIPVEKGMLFRTQTRKNNPEGRSVLRSAYRSWYFKRRVEEIEAIGIERDLAGLPQLKGPPGKNLFDQNDPVMVTLRREAEAIVRGVRRDELEGILLNDGWEFKLTSSGGGRQLDVDKVINRYDRNMAVTVLADVLLIGHESVGSFALADAKGNLLAVSLGAILDMIQEVFNRYAIPRLIRLNPFTVEQTPQLRHGDITKRDLEKLGNFIQKMAQTGAITLGPEIEDYLRSEGGLPPRPEDAPDPAEDVEDEDVEDEDAAEDPAQDPELVGAGA